MNNVVIVGGHGKISLSLARLLVQGGFTVTSVIRNPEQAPAITALSAVPHILSLEEAPVSAFTALFAKTRAQLVYFSAGAGGKGGPARTRAVDYEGAVKVFDAVEAVEGEKPRVILVSSIDTRNPDTLETFPAHYNEADKEMSRRAHGAMEMYFKWKYEADKNLVARTAFRWTILRPGELIDGPGTGRVDVGRMHLTKSIPRDDVATTLYHLASRPDAHGLALDVIGGPTPVTEALDLAIKKGETSFSD